MTCVSRVQKREHVAGDRSCAESGWYVKISDTGHHGSSRGHDLVLRRRMVMRGRSTSSVMTSNVPNGDRHFSACGRSFPGRSEARLS